MRERKREREREREKRDERDNNEITTGCSFYTKFWVVVNQ